MVALEEQVLTGKGRDRDIMGPGDALDGALPVSHWTPAQLGPLPLEPVLGVGARSRAPGDLAHVSWTRSWGPVL